MANEIQFILYNLPEGNGTVQAIVREDTVWLTQKAMSELSGVDRSVITKHLKNIFESAELQEDSVCAKFAHTASDGKNYNTTFYSLDAIVSCSKIIACNDTFAHSKRVIHALRLELTQSRKDREVIDPMTQITD